MTLGFLPIFLQKVSKTVKIKTSFGREEFERRQVSKRGVAQDVPRKHKRTGKRYRQERKLHKKGSALARKRRVSEERKKT